VRDEGAWPLVTPELRIVLVLVLEKSGKVAKWQSEPAGMDLLLRRQVCNSRHKIVIAGKHDFSFEEKPAAAPSRRIVRRVDSAAE
jgi:hypothetical protein